MVDQEQRKLKPIYDALDSGSYKAAIQTCNKLLKKQPQHETIRALKSLALLRANKAEEAIQLCDEILASKPTDDTVLGIMQHVLKHLDRTPEITAMFEDAFKKQPGNEELGAQTFMSHIRVGSWKSAQLIALKLFKSFKQPKYLFWSIMSAVLQAQNAGGVNPGMTDNAPILLNLALRMVTSSPIPSYVSPDHFYLHLTILKTLDKLDEAYEHIQSERGKRLCETSLVVDELRREIFLAKGACREEAVLCGERLSKKGDRNWITFLSLIDSTFDVIKLNESQSKCETDSVAPATDSEGAGPPPSEAKETPSSTEGNGGEVDPELTPKPTPHPELPLEPQALIDGLRELFERLAKEDGLKERGGHLASLQLEKRVRIREEGQGKSVPDTLVSLLKQYFNNFSDKTCCFEDLKTYVASLQERELTSWLGFLKEQADACDFSTPAGLARSINVFKLQRFSSTSRRTEADEQTDAATYLKAYFEALPDLSETDLQPADDLAILAANGLVSAWVITRKETYLHQALVVLECASSKSKQNYQLRILAVRIYRLLAANGPALSHYRTMDVKQVQTDTLSHLILSRGSTYSLAPVGDVGMTQECITASDIYNQNSSDTADMIIKAFQFEKYSQITEFVEFEDRLDNSLQRDLTRLEYVRMKFTTEKLEPEALLLELQELEFVLEKMHHDNRDFAVIPNYQPRGQSLADQTSMGVVRGFQWLTVFLQLYIRAYARACRVETSVASDMNTFLSGWLSEMTEDEKTFLKFSQILHEWIPCPPLLSREAAMAALTGTATPSDATAAPAQNGGVDPAAKTNGDQERKQSPPPPHVKQDGSG
ncbi:hypothetical protein M407DRAFT_30110 [Tulasnella calospora MUT 4182]|uniref:Uncharacterized protein n=1 Tax=Tulasnella calospora MUT 4182 TaxID=1051891 RepID=A0A0C3KFJ7_9AGAM|nr:hypothetical protein M407DRAFT_30110 [Tulasnella calospora MUT 4182]